MGKRLLSEFRMDADYKTQINKREGGRQIAVFRCPIYLKWMGVKERAGDGVVNTRTDAYLDVDICDDWLSFMGFRNWVLDQPQWEGLALDKDLLIPGNRIYCPEYCRFVPHEINCCLLVNGKDWNDFPLGVHTKTKNPGAYFAHLTSPDGFKSVKSFKTPEQAHEAWCRSKVKRLEFLLQDWRAQPSYDVGIANNILAVRDRLVYNLSEGVETLDLTI